MWSSVLYCNVQLEHFLLKWNQTDIGRFFLIEKLMRGIFILVEICWFWFSGPTGIHQHILVEQCEQDSAEGMSWSCCSPVLRPCCSEPHQSPTSVSVQHGQPLSPPHSRRLHNLPASLCLPSLSLQSHMKACLTYACQRNILHHEDKCWEEKENEPTENTHTNTITPTSSHCKGQSGSSKVRNWSLLFSFSCLPVADSLLREPANTQSHVSVWEYTCVDFFLVLNYDSRKSLVSKTMVKGLLDSLSFQRGGILLAD